MKRCVIALLALLAVSTSLDARRRCNKGKCARPKDEVASCDREPCCIKTVTVKKPAIRQCHYTWVCPEGYEANGYENEGHESK